MFDLFILMAQMCNRVNSLENNIDEMAWSIDVADFLQELMWEMLFLDFHP